MIYTFTLVLEPCDTTGDFDSRLYKSGCDDALISILDGKVYLDFDRDASSFDDAVKSAKLNILLAGYRAEVV